MDLKHTPEKSPIKTKYEFVKLVVIFVTFFYPILKLLFQCINYCHDDFVWIKLLLSIKYELFTFLKILQLKSYGDYELEK